MRLPQCMSLHREGRTAICFRRRWCLSQDPRNMGLSEISGAWGRHSCLPSRRPENRNVCPALFTGRSPVYITNRVSASFAVFYNLKITFNLISLSAIHPLRQTKNAARRPCCWIQRRLYFISAPLIKYPIIFDTSCVGVWPSPVKALDWGSRDRWFNSSHPDHFIF